MSPFTAKTPFSAIFIPSVPAPITSLSVCLSFASGAISFKFCVVYFLHFKLKIEQAAGGGGYEWSGGKPRRNSLREKTIRP